MKQLPTFITQIPGIQPILGFLECIGHHLKKPVTFWNDSRDIWQVLHYTRFSLFVTLLGAAVLFIPQGRELALSLDQHWLHYVFFFLGLSGWAVHNWFGSRSLLNERFGRPLADKTSPEYASVFQISLRETPRILGLSAFIFAVIQLALIKANPFILVSTALLGVAFYWLAIKRSDRMNAQNPAVDNLQPIADILCPLTWAYSGLLILAGILFPAHTGFFMGSLGILFFGLSSIVPVGNWAIYHTEKLTDPDFFGTDKSNAIKYHQTGFPVVTALLLLAFAFSFINDNHEIRTLDAKPKRQSLPEAFDTWEAQATPNQDDVKPLIIVATAGGGIRAAYWTATVLGGLTDADARFRNALFAISGVSGGSVGSAFYYAALAEDQKQCTATDKAKPKRGNGASQYECLTHLAMDQDFLAPNFSSLLYSDLLQRFIPIGLLPDRQQALEKGWELAWRESYAAPRTQGLAAGLSTPPTHGRLPILMLNSTHIESGKRVVASSVTLDKDHFTDTVDLLSLINRDLRLSTAAGNSARFTYVSPAGTLPCNPATTDCSNNGHVVDGGYFENFGAITAMQTLDALRAEIPADKLKNIKPIFLVISSDPNLACSPKRLKDDIEKNQFSCDSIDADLEVTRLPGSRGGNEILAPVKGVASARSDRGILAARELWHWANDCKTHQTLDTAGQTTYCGFGHEPEFYHFKMAIPDGQDEPALGWMLSEPSKQLIDGMLNCSADPKDTNREAFISILTAVTDPQTALAQSKVCLHR